MLVPCAWPVGRSILNLNCAQRGLQVRPGPREIVALLGGDHYGADRLMTQCQVSAAELQMCFRLQSDIVCLV